MTVLPTPIQKPKTVIRPESESQKSCRLNYHLSATVLGLTDLLQKQVFTFQSKLDQNLVSLSHSATGLQETGSCILLALLLSSTNTCTKKHWSQFFWRHATLHFLSP